LTIVTSTAHPTVVCYPASGSAFPVGTTPVNCTATDLAGNSSSCKFKVTVLGSICGKKFYDANANSVDDSDPGIAGWKIVITDTSGAQPAVTVYTDNTGHYCVDARIGTYTVKEVPPNATWANTTAASRQV